MVNEKQYTYVQLSRCSGGHHHGLPSTKKGVIHEDIHYGAYVTDQDGLVLGYSHSHPFLDLPDKPVPEFSVSRFLG